MSSGLILRLTALSMLLPSGTGIAQLSQLSPPTETDLHAAYCSEAINLEIDMVEKTLPSVVSPEVLRIRKATLETEKAILSKLDLYLLPRLMYIDPLGIVGAQAAAKDDFGRIMSSTTACKSECPITPGFDAAVLEKCTLECVTRAMADFPAVQKKLKSCQDLEWLPF